MSLTVYLSIADSFFLWGSQRKRLIYVDAIFVSVVAPMLYSSSLLTQFISTKPIEVTQLPFSMNRWIPFFRTTTVRRLFRKQGTQRSEIGHSSCSVLFILLWNPTKVNANTCVSMRLEKWTNVFVTSYIWCERCTYDLFECKVANV